MRREFKVTPFNCSQIDHGSFDIEFSHPELHGVPLVASLKGIDLPALEKNIFLCMQALQRYEAATWRGMPSPMSVTYVLNLIGIIDIAPSPNRIDEEMFNRRYLINHDPVQISIPFQDVLVDEYRTAFYLESAKIFDEAAQILEVNCKRGFHHHASVEDILTLLGRAYREATKGMLLEISTLSDGRSKDVSDLFMI